MYGSCVFLSEVDVDDVDDVVEVVVDVVLPLPTLFTQYSQSSVLLLLELSVAYDLLVVVDEGWMMASVNRCMTDE